MESSSNQKPEKPLGHRAYGSIPHLPGSRRGPADKGLTEHQARILTEKGRDRHDTIIVQEKLDGSCVGVAKLDGRLIALIRAGFPAAGSNYKQHHVFADWVDKHSARFEALLSEGERVCGEWLMEAHGTIYQLPHEPFVAFDILRGHDRTPALDVASRCAAVDWRCERKGTVDFLGKFVRPDKVDGKYLENISGGKPIYNWLPERGDSSAL